MRTQKIEQSPAPQEQAPAPSPSRNREVPRRPAQPVSAARPPVETSEERPEPSRPGGYTLGSGMGKGFMLGSGN